MRFLVMRFSAKRFLAIRFLMAIVALLWTAAGSSADVIVKDGRTLQIAEIVYRLDGIDAPEFDQICIDEHADPWACGVEARDQLAKLIGGRGVHCTDLGQDKNYGKRQLGICSVDGATERLNQLMVRQGFALNFEPASDEPYARGGFDEDEAAAKTSRLGLWRGCFVAPRAFRRWDKTAALLGSSCAGDKDRELRQALFPDEPAMPPGCAIKAKYVKRARFTGHVGVYQLQGCPSYASLVKPDRWFCSADDAQAAGFRKAFNCFAGSHRRP
jgi:endonuclease YncB( thermonuclease family)